MNKWFSAALAIACLLALVAVAGQRAEGIVIAGSFVDDNGSTFEGDIDAIAAADITRGCNPPANDRYCPNDEVTRGQMAAFLRRALELPATDTDYFIDDNGSTFEGDINAIAAADITRGCNPPANDRYCPNDEVTRGQMAAFLRRALELPFITLPIPVGSHNAMQCSKDGERCSLTVDLSPNRTYRIEEGLYQVSPASSAEEAEFSSSGTSFAMSLDGSGTSVTELSQGSGEGVVERLWRRDITLSPGTHTLVGVWRWNGEVIQTNTITLRAG